MLKVLLTFYALDTILTAYATTTGLAREMNPLYWSFQYGVAEGVIVRVLIGAVTIGWMRKNLSSRLLQLVTVTYATLVLITAAVVYGSS